MKHIKIYEAFDPFKNLTGDDKKVFDAVGELCDSLFNYEWFEDVTTRRRIEPIITTILDQNKSAHGGARPEGAHVFDKQYYVFVNNFDGKGYIEIEMNIDSYGNSVLDAKDAEPSSHGYPASYGSEIYSYNNKTGEIEYDREFFKYLLR